MDKLKQNKTCDHKNGLPMYGRGERWISTRKILGEMVFICPDCGAFYKKGITNIPQVSKEEDREICKEISEKEEVTNHGQQVNPIIPDGQSKAERVGRLRSGQRSIESKAAPADVSLSAKQESMKKGDIK